MSNKELPSLEKLDKAIKDAKQRNEPQKNKESVGSPVKYSVDLIAGVAVGSFIGYHVDKWLETKALFFIICFFLGVAGAAMNIYRDVKNLSSKE